MADLSAQELSDDELAQLIQLGVIPEEQAQLLKQQQQAQMLQQKGLPEGRQAGRVYVAPNPLEFVGAVGNAIKAQHQEKDIQGQLDALRKQQVQGRQLYADKLLDTPYRRQSMTVPMQTDPDFGIKPPMSF